MSVVLRPTVTGDAYSITVPAEYAGKLAVIKADATPGFVGRIIDPSGDVLLSQLIDVNSDEALEHILSNVELTTLLEEGTYTITSAYLDEGVIKEHSTSLLAECTIEVDVEPIAEDGIAPASTDNVVYSELAANLYSVLQTKRAIRDVLIAKGCKLTSDTRFEDYPALIATLGNATK